MHESPVVRFAERQADLLEQVNGPIRPERSEPLHESVEVQAVEQFHHVVEGAIIRGSEVVQLDRMGRPEIRCRPGLAPKSLDNDAGAVRVLGS
ncbi:MAG: hypothetical protein P8049_08555 [Gemmatimonadota bacterium]